jgi:hypothetical protein
MLQRPAKPLRSFAAPWVAAFVVLLLSLQTLGLLHGILHTPATAGSAYESSAQPHQAAAGDGVALGVAQDGGGNSSASFLTHLFSGHLTDADCRAYDQLSHFDAASSVAAVALPLVLTPFLLSTLTGLATARWHALFQARGPPSLR